METTKPAEDCEADHTVLVEDQGRELRQCPDCGRFQLDFGNAVLMLESDDLRTLHRVVDGQLSLIANQRKAPASWASNQRLSNGPGPGSNTVIQVGRGMGIRLSRTELLELHGLLVRGLRAEISA